MKAFFARNKVDIIISLGLAVITGLIFYYPNYRIKTNISTDEMLSKHFAYSPFVSQITPARDQLSYAMYTRKAMDGNMELGDPNIYERRHDVSPINKLPYIIGGIMSRLLGSVGSFFRLIDFFLPFLSIIIGYFFLRLFLENRLMAFWGIIILLSMYGYTQFLNIFLFRFDAAFGHVSNFKDAFNVYATKYPSYQLVFPFTFLFYYCCYQLFRNNNVFYLLATGILAGLSFYMYVYSFPPICLQILFLMIWSYISGRRSLAFKFFIAGILALAIGCFYLRDLVLFALGSAYVDKSMASGLTRSVDYDMTKALLKSCFFAAILLYTFLRIRRIDHRIDDRFLFILSIMAPAVSLMVVSAVVFFLPQTQHLNSFELRNVHILSLLLLLSVCLDKNHIKKIVPGKIGEFIEKRHCYVKIFFIVFLLLHSVQVMASQFYYLHKKSSLYSHKYTIDRSSMEAYTWLSKHASKDSVLLSLDEQQISLSPIFTGLYVYIPNMFCSMSPIDEVWRRIKEGFGFYGIDRDVLRHILKGYESFEYESLLDSKPQSFEDIKKSEDAAIEFRKKLFPRTVFHGYFRLDSKSLSFQQYKKYCNPDELIRIYKNEHGKSYYQGLLLIPLNLMEEQLADYKPDKGNIDLLKYKVDYVWFGPLEKNLTGVDGVASEKLRVVFQNEKVKIYKIEP